MATSNGDITAHRRAYALPPNQNKCPSARAGTNQAQTNEGARGECAARCTNCQVGIQSNGDSKWPRLETAAKAAGGGAVMRQCVRKTHTVS